MLIHQVPCERRIILCTLNVKVSKSENKYVRSKKKKKSLPFCFSGNILKGFQSDLSDPFHKEVIRDGSLSALQVSVKL